MADEQRAVVVPSRSDGQCGGQWLTVRRPVLVDGAAVVALVVVVREQHRRIIP